MYSEHAAPRLSVPRSSHAGRFVLGPSALLSALGLLRPTDRAVPTPAERWQDAVVDVVIPVDQHQAIIVHCLTALLAQSLRPRQVLLVDDGGVDRDGSVVVAREFARANAMTLQVVERQWSIGRAPTVKRQAREFDGDVLFVLDADTVMESKDYLERCVRELYQGVGIASTCGTSLPLRGQDRRALSVTAPFQRWLGKDDYRDRHVPLDRGLRFEQWLADTYRECTALVQQRFVQRGQMRAFGSIGHPPSGAVAYRRRYLKDLFDRYEPIHGDRLTHAEDLFIGFALAHAGYRNVQLGDVIAREQQRELQALPRQIARGATAYLQGCFHFDALLYTPLRWPRHWWRSRRPPAGSERRRVVEAFRQPFGERLTREQGRPVGWVLVATALEKLAVPAVLLGLLVTGQWRWAAALVVTELVIWLAALVVVGGQSRMQLVGKGLLVAPLRYAAMLAEVVGTAGFMLELWRHRGRRPVS